MRLSSLPRGVEVDHSHINEALDLCAAYAPPRLKSVALRYARLARLQPRTQHQEPQHIKRSILIQYINKCAKL